MKATAEIDRREERVRQRLSRTSHPEQEGPVLRGGNEVLEVHERVRATDLGGISVIHRLVREIGLPKVLDESLNLLQRPCPYYVSDHVLNLTYNILCGGRTLDDLERLRCDEAYLDLLGAARIPDPTTAGDFLRRLSRDDCEILQECAHVIRQRILKKLSSRSLGCAIVDVDGTIAPTDAECKEGMDRSYDGQWGFQAQIVSLANSMEVLATRILSGNRPSHDDIFDLIDPVLARLREVGYQRVLLRGDTAFALTRHFDELTEDNVSFVFGMKAHRRYVKLAEGLAEQEWTLLRRKARPLPRKPRAKKTRVKEERVREREYRNVVLHEEHYAEFAYRPGKCTRDCRMIVVRKTLHVMQGQALLFPEIRYFFYITNATKRFLSARQVIAHANQRCNQENLIEQLKNGVHGLRLPCNELAANDAYFAIASLAWNLKQWVALLWHEQEQGNRIRRMDFRGFVNGFIRIPCQVVDTGRRLLHRFLKGTPWLRTLLDFHTRLRKISFAG